jgi:uncharacterized protein
MIEKDKKEIAQSFIRGLGIRDANLLHSIVTEDVVWSLPGESPMSGEAHGVEAILKRASTLHVALHLHNTRTYAGKVLDEHLTTVIHLDGDKIHRLDTFISDIPMLNKYFA